jgi:hypothetical protein
MSTMALTIPPRPEGFHPRQAPPGYRISLVSFNNERRKITPRLQLAHTNGASGQGSIESSKAWAERRTVNGVATTLPHFQVDRDGDAAMLLELDRQGIASAKANPFCIAYETADTGYKTDPAISEFTGAQLQMMANGFAYCSMLYKIGLEYPKTWDGNGSASHTEPFSYPYWTSYNGKICPGTKKKAQVRDVILPHARAIVAAWSGQTAPPPKPPPTTGSDDVNWKPSSATVNGVTSAPPVDSTLAGQNNDWAVIALIKALQKQAGLPVTGTYNQATGNVINELI